MNPEQTLPPPAVQAPAMPALAQYCQRLMNLRVGIIPLPIYLALAVVVTTFTLMHKVPGDLLMAAATLALLGFSCAEIGKRVPYLKEIGGAAIMATFVPSCLAFYQLIPADLLNMVSSFTKSSNFLYLFISCIIVGSILGMDRDVLIRSFVKIFIPLALGTVAAAVVGTAVGTALGLGTQHTLFFIVIPILAGGVGEGAIPLSMGYSDILGLPQGDMFAQVLPSVMLGSLTAIIMSGLLGKLGRKYPHLTGEGRVSLDDHSHPESLQKRRVSGDVSDIAAGGLIAIVCYLLGSVMNKITGLPAPIAMLFIAVLLKLLRLIPHNLEDGAFTVYKFFQVGVTYPLLFAIGASMTPWDKLVSAFHVTNLVTIIATVATLIATGFYSARWLRMFPIETAIINACHSGQGGTGDVAILTASDRMMLMPFAQIATRIGGAVTVTLALIGLNLMH